MPLAILKKLTALRIGSLISFYLACQNVLKVQKIERGYADLKSATSILTEVDSSIQPFSIGDTVRLGKFNPTGHPRSMLVMLKRSANVSYFNPFQKSPS